MKNLYTALIFALAGLTLTAQNKDTEKADKLFQKYEYVDAAQEYLKLVDKGKADNYVYLQLADTYYNMFNTAEAARWYAKATEQKQDAEIYYRYAQMLKATGKYEESNKQMRTFAQMAPNDLRAKAFNENPNYIPRLLDKNKLYEVKASDVSSEKSDFAAVLYDKSVWFASARNTARKDYGWTDEPFLDIYRADYNDDGTITNAAAVSELNSKFHDGPVSVSADGNTLFFSSESFKEKESERNKKLNAKFSQVWLFKATREGDKWGNVTPLPFNSKEYSCANPSLSRDGKTLYFSSNMPGSMGTTKATDIWKVSINGDGYGTPENLGKNINTEGAESFPYISDDNTTLYFASSGRPGLGGYDVFQADLAKNTEATNLGKPVNTEKDDFAFTFNKQRKVGFVSSNRNGNDDIFIVSPICGVQLTTVVSDARTGNILSNASVSVVDDKKNVISTEMSNARGEVTYRVECNREYTIQASKDGYEGASFPVTRQDGGEQKVDARLQPIETIVKETEIVLNPIFFEFDKSNVTREGAFELDKLVQVMKSNPNLTILAKAHTDNRGSDAYNLSLSDRRAKSTVQYVISRGISKGRITGKGFGESEPKVDCREQCTEEQHAQNRRSEFLIVK